MTTFQLDKDAAQCVVSWRHFSWAILVLLLWLAIWTVGCVMLGREVFVNGQQGMLLFALPFWGAWFFVVALLVNMLFGKTRFRLDADGLDTEWTCLFLKREKRIELGDLRRFEVHAYHRKNAPAYAIRVVHLDEKHADFSVPAHCGELEPIRDQLNDVLATLKHEPNISVGESKPKKPEPIVFDLTATPKETEPPKTCPWRFETDFDGFGFSNRGVFSLGNCLGSLLAACFWNGIVSVFLLALFGVFPSEKPMAPMGWWFLFLFLIPFELVGLVLIFSFLQTVLAQFRVTKWSFRYGEATFKPAFGRSKSFALDGWKTLAVRPESDEETDDDSDVDDEFETWELAFLDRDGAALVSIGELDKAAALWMADVVLREKRSIR